MTETPPSPRTPRAEANARRADAERIASGYESTGCALEMGAVLLDGTSYPQARIRVPLAMVNRHGLIAGATGTGKTKTLQVLTEQLSAAGVPVVDRRHQRRPVRTVAGGQVQRPDLPASG